MAQPNDKPPVLDRVLGYFSPRWGAERAALRSLELSYRGGISTRTGNPWATSTSYQYGTQALRQNQASMRDRARKVYRDNAIGRSVLDTETDNVIADGFTLQARTASKDFNKESEERFGEWLDTADVRGLRSGSGFQRMVWTTCRRDGDGGVVLVSRGGTPRLQFIPGDLIKTPDGKVAQPSIVDGVEMDATQRPRTFHILDTDEWGKRKFGTIPARDFIYLPHLDDPFDVRGTTAYATVFELLDQIDGYRDAVIIAARMAAIFGLIFKQANAGNTVNRLGTLTNSQGDQQKAITIENGMAKYIGQGDDVVQVQAGQPMQQTPDFLTAMMRQIGLPFQMPLEVIAKDVSRANLSSLRGGRQDYYRSCKPKQCWFADRFLSRVYIWWLESTRDQFTSAVPAESYLHEFMPQGWQFTDPITEAQAAQLEIDMGINCPQNVTAMLGRDYETIQQQNADARNTRIAAGLPIIHSNLTRHPQLGVGAEGDPLGVDKAEPEQPKDAPNEQ